MRFPRARSTVSRRLIYGPHRLFFSRKETTKERSKKKEGEEGTRGHTHTRAWHPLSGKKGALALFVQRQRESSLHRNCSPGEIPAPGQRIARSPNIRRRFLERTCAHESSIISRTLNTQTGTPSRHASLMYSRGNIITLESFSVTCPFTRSTCQLLHQWPLRSFASISSECPLFQH